jgi:hypothetical protein
MANNQDWRETFPDVTQDSLNGQFGVELSLSNIHWNVEPDPSPRNVYEYLRRTLLDLGSLVVELQLECTKDTCPTLNVPGGSFLCAVHSAPSNCCAIDYIIHTMDGGTSMLTSIKHFPDRQVSSDSLKLLQNLSRRLYRIFAHVWFSHRELFLQHEQQTNIYKQFMALVDVAGLLPKASRVIPDAAMA